MAIIMDGDEGLSSLKAVPYLYTVFFFLLNLSTSFIFFFLNSPDRERFSSCCSRSANPEKLRSTIWNGPTCTSVHNTCARTHMCFRKKTNLFMMEKMEVREKFRSPHLRPKTATQSPSSSVSLITIWWTLSLVTSKNFGRLKELRHTLLSSFYAESPCFYLHNTYSKKRSTTSQIHFISNSNKEVKKSCQEIGFRILFGKRRFNKIHWLFDCCLCKDSKKDLLSNI